MDKNKELYLLYLLFIICGIMFLIAPLSQAINTSLAFYIIFGSMWLIAGVYGIISRLHKNNKINRLKKKGTLVYAKLVEIQVNENVILFGSNPSKLICEWVDDSGTRHRFVKKKVGISYNIKDNNAIPVYISPNNINNYYIDVE